MNTLETYRLEKSKMFYDTFSLSTVMLAIWAWLTFGEKGRAVKSSWGWGWGFAWPLIRASPQKIEI